MSDERRNSRLPPPAFPPGGRRPAYRNNSTRPRPRGPVEDGVRDDAFISPDDPLPPRSDALERAIILPDEPLPERRPDALRGAILSPEDPLSRRRPAATGEEGVVTGIGSDPHLEREELVAGGDPHVMEVADAIRKLAEALGRKGEAGLRTTPTMSRFEATLRAYCVGYLAGRRAEEEAERQGTAARARPKAEPPVGD